jgi:hypothetical protein
LHHDLLLIDLTPFRKSCAKINLSTFKNGEKINLTPFRKSCAKINLSTFKNGEKNI